MPRTPFIGVRISWLMFARNSLFARLAASAGLDGGVERFSGLAELFGHPVEGGGELAQLVGRVNVDPRVEVPLADPDASPLGASSADPRSSA